MNNTVTQTETRKVSGFDRVAISGNTCSARVYITQGEQEGLTIKAPPEYLRRLRSEVKGGRLTVRLEGSWLQELEDALSTCLNKPAIIYHLDVCHLTHLEVQCADFVHAPRLETTYLHVKLNGTGDFYIDWLAAESLEVRHAGAGILRASGKVEEQAVTLSGAGSYLAANLVSQRARVRITGPSLARMHVSEALEATLRGPGCLEYSGDANVSQRISGPGRIVQVVRTG
jgi:hypothetical protein